MEKFQISRHQTKFYTNIIVTATYTIPKSSSLSIRDYVYRACETAIADQPALSAILKDDDTKDPIFVRLPQIDLDQVISFHQRETTLPETDSTGEPPIDIDLQNLMEEQHNIFFTAPNPFWRLCILSTPENPYEFTALMVFHHGLGDAGSGGAFHLTFVRALRAASESNRQTNTVIKSPKSSISPTLEDLHPLTTSYWYLAKMAVNRILWPPTREPGLWTGGRIQTPLLNGLRLIPLSKSLVDALRKLCKEENTTITALLQVILARAVFANISDEYSKINYSGFISLRRWLTDLTDEYMGFFVTDYEDSYTRSTVTPTDKTLIWDEARRSRKTIEDALALEGRNSGVALLRYVKDYHKDLCYGAIGKERSTSFQISNIGALKSEFHSEKPSIKGMAFSQSAGVAGAVISCNVMTGPDGQLSLCVTWNAAQADGVFIDSVLASVRKELLDIGKAGK